MKYFALFLVSLIAVAYAAEEVQLNNKQRERVREVVKVCIGKVGTTKEAVQDLASGKFANAGQKEKCFANCFLEELNFISNGVPVENVIREKLGAVVGAEQINALMQKCNGEHGSDNCDTALKLFECYYKNKAAFLQY